MVEELVPVIKSIQVGEAWEGISVLEGVRRAFENISPREVFKKVRMREIVLNDSVCTPMALLREGDILKVTLFQPPHPKTRPVLRADEYVTTPAGPFVIVREDDDLLVVSKPPGCASHPALGHSGDTLIERVRAYLKVSPDDEFQPALANRLDVETSGIVLIGKTKLAQRKLGLYLQKSKIIKKYVALVAGHVEGEAGRIDMPLEKRPDSRDLAKYPPGHPRRDGRMQEALTLYKVIARSSNPLAATLVEIELVTGRNHQIRRHFAMAGHPVAMDKRYGDRDFNDEIEEIAELERMFLHARYMELDHPLTKEKLVLRAPLPEPLEECLKVFGIDFGEAFEKIDG